MTPRVRDATPDDAEPVARLLTELGYPTTAAEVPARLERLAGSRGTALVAERDAQVVGLVTAHRIAVLNRVHDVTWITTLIVDQDARAAGAGRALVEEVERQARVEGCERLSVTTYDHLTGAQAFYLRLGFERTGHRFGKRLTPTGTT